MCCNPLRFTLQSTDIDAPRDLKATDVTLDSAVLTWIPPLADIDGYILTYRDEDGNMEVGSAGLLRKVRLCPAIYSAMKYSKPTAEE